MCLLGEEVTSTEEIDNGVELLSVGTKVKLRLTVSEGWKSSVIATSSNSLSSEGLSS